MKSLLGVLGAIGLTATTGATVVSCKKDSNSDIQVDAKVSVKMGETEELAIKNAANLKDIKVKDGYEKTKVTVEIDGDKVKVTGVAEGKVDVFIQAKDKTSDKQLKEAKITVTITKKDTPTDPTAVEINAADKAFSIVKATGTKTITITNAAALKTAGFAVTTADMNPASGVTLGEYDESKGTISVTAGATAQEVKFNVVATKGETKLSTEITVTITE